MSQLCVSATVFIYGSRRWMTLLNGACVCERYWFPCSVQITWIMSTQSFGHGGKRTQCKATIVEGGRDPQKPVIFQSLIHPLLGKYMKKGCMVGKVQGWWIPPILPYINVSTLFWFSSFAQLIKAKTYKRFFLPLSLLPASSHQSIPPLHFLFLHTLPSGLSTKGCVGP